MSKTPFTSVIFAGGGCRCLWQAGFYSTAAKELGLKPAIVAGVSAGSAIACMSLSGRLAEGIEFFKEITAKNKKNVYASALFTGRSAFPHNDMYRSVILHSIDAKALDMLRKNGPEIRILVARAPKLLGPVSATFAGFIAYTFEKYIFNPVHPSAGAAIGFSGEVFTAQQCRTPGELCDLICASSCTPPFVPVQHWGGKIALDGGLIDNVPVSAIDRERKGGTLLLLTRRYADEKLPEIPGRVYIQPSENVPLSKMDYTNPDGIQTAFELGRKDAFAFSRSFTKEKRKGTRVR